VRTVRAPELNQVRRIKDGTVTDVDNAEEEPEMSQFGDGLDAVVQKAFTRPAPKSAGAQMRYLVKQLKGTRAVARLLRVSQRTVERYVKDQITKPARAWPRAWSLR
jgi:hypothetical protein